MKTLINLAVLLVLAGLWYLVIYLTADPVGGHITINNYVVEGDKLNMIVSAMELMALYGLVSAVLDTFSIGKDLTNCIKK